jgi:hypothetical protein
MPTSVRLSPYDTDEDKTYNIFFFQGPLLSLVVSAIYMPARNAKGAEGFCSRKRFGLQLNWQNSLEETTWHKIEHNGVLL